MNVGKKFETIFHGEQSENVFRSNFKKVNNEGYDIDLDCIIIFDGGDVDGYEEDPKNNI